MDDFTTLTFGPPSAERLEEDRQEGITPFSSYNTGSLPSGGPARNLSVVSAYAEAGIQMLSTGKSQASFARVAHELPWRRVTPVQAGIHAPSVKEGR